LETAGGGGGEFQAYAFWRAMAKGFGTPSLSGERRVNSG